MKKTAWEFSAAVSSIQFKIRYYSISVVQGCFLGFEGSVLTDETFTNPEIRLRIEASSVHTNNDTSNRSIRSADCLHTAAYPYLQFVAKDGCRQSPGGIWELTGQLTIKSITKEIVFVVSQHRVKKGTMKPVICFNLFGSISRKAFDLPADDQNLHDQVQLTAELELTAIS